MLPINVMAASCTIQIHLSGIVYNTTSSICCTVVVYPISMMSIDILPFSFTCAVRNYTNFNSFKIFIVTDNLKYELSGIDTCMLNTYNNDDNFVKQIV